jgi:hypothetical protein
MPATAHLGDARLDSLASGSAALSTHEHEHLRSCRRCGDLLEAYRSIGYALSGTWSSSASTEGLRASRRRRPYGVLATLLSAAVLVTTISAASLALFVSAPMIGSTPTGSPYASPTAAVAVGSSSASPWPSASAPPSPLTSPSAPPSPPPTPGHTAPASITPRPPMLTIEGANAFRGWSPDGELFAALRSNDFAIFRVDGSLVGSISAREVYWVTPTSLAAFGAPGAGPAVGQVKFFGSDGTLTSTVPEDFESVVFAPLGGTFAGVEPAADGESLVSAYRVWDGSRLSERRNGIPMAWSPDGGALAVLVPEDIASDGGRFGGLLIVDPSGAPLAELRQWIGTANGVFWFSPDGRYLAACLHSGEEPAPSLRVVDTETSSVSPPVGECGFASWTSANHLYVADASNPATKWSPTDGIDTVGTPAGTFVQAALTGALATWSASGDPKLQVVTEDSTRAYQLSGEIRQVAWSADGTELAVTAASSAPSGGYGVTIIRLP